VGQIQIHDVRDRVVQIVLTVQNVTYAEKENTKQNNLSDAGLTIFSAV
jgi:hypothetical protein